MLNDKRVWKDAGGERVVSYMAYPGRGRDIFEEYGGFKDFFSDMNICLDTGSQHQKEGQGKWSLDEFLTKHPNIDLDKLNSLPSDTYAMIIDMLYGIYCDGFDAARKSLL